MAALPSSSSSASLAEDWAVLVTSSSAVVTDEATDDIRWHFEDPRIGGKLKRNGIVFLDERRFVLHFRDSASYEKILSKGKHNVSVKDKDIEMTVESYPVNIGTKDSNKTSSVMMETEDDWISVPTNRFDDDLTRSSSEGINIPDECHLDTEQPFDDHGPRSMLDGFGTSPDSDVGQRTIQVLDVPENMLDLVLLYLESAKHGGGDVDIYSYDEESRISNATFLERDVAKHFVSRGSISIDGREMKLRALPVEAESDNRTKEETMETEENTDSVPKNMIEVTDLTPKLTQEMLKLYFENRKRSGGGTIKDIQLFPDEERAIITFMEAEAAERVIEKSEHLVLGVPVKCVPLDAAAINSPSCAIEVRGFDEKASEEMLTLFFENRRRSGGGRMENLYYNVDERRAVITFESPEVVERVLQNHRCKPLSLNEVRLTISALKPAAFPLCSADDIEPDKILVHNIPSDSSKDDLVCYVQRGATASVKKIRYSLLPGTAMAYFRNVIDYARLRDLVISRPFRGVMLSIEKVPASHSIQVFNIDGISLDHIVLYFESSKSGGDEIKESEINASEGFAILTFEKREALSSVLSKKHKLEDRILSVSEYYKGLGVMPPDVDSESPAWWLPPQLSLTCESQKLDFIMSSSKLKAKIEKELEAAYCKVEWPAAVGSADPRAPCAVVLHCALNHSTKNVGQLAKTWTNDCTDKMNREFSNILFEEINVLQELWKNVSDRRKSLEDDIRDKENVQIIVDDSSCTIRVLGVQKSCKKFVESLKELVSQAQQELENEKRKISEQIQKLKGHQFEILKAIGFLDSNNGDTVDVTINGQDVSFFGQPNDILAKKLKMYEILNAICAESLELPSFVLEALKLTPFRNHITSCLQDQKVVSAWNLGPKGLSVYGLSQSEIDKTASILKSEVLQRQMELDASEASTLLLPGWNALKTSIDNDFKIVSLKESGSTISIMGTSSNMNAVLEVVHNFIKENAIKEEFLMAQKGTAAVVNQYLKAELQAICRDFQSCRVTIKEDLNASRAGFTVSGTVHGLQSALNKVAELLKKVVEKEKVLDRPGISGYLRSTRGQKQVDVIQSRHCVFIVDWEEANRANAVATDSKKSVAAATGANSGHQAQILDEIRLKGTFAVKVVLGNITEYKVDAIVNAANGQLEHYGGVARAIVDKGGPDIQNECRNHIKSTGPLLAGHYFVSKPGSLPCKYIFHAVGPIWEGGHKNEENVLFETVYNVLVEAEKRKLQSIAMPAISTGVYGFPMRKAAKITMETVAEFVEKETPRSLQEVHIIDNNRNATREFKDMLAILGAPSKRRSGTGRPTVLDDDEDDDDEHDASPYRSFRGGSSVDADIPRYLYKTSSDVRPSKSSATSPSSSSSSSVSSNVLTTPEGLKITLVKGSIVEQTVDVIVNTTAQNLALNNGAVSSLILQTAGPSIQAECKRKAPNGLNLGEVVITPGYSLPCKFVYHGYCINWDGAHKGPCEQSIRDLLKSIFLEAHTKLVKSIAIPAIGTGNLKVPPDLVAKIMYEEGELFSSNHVGTTLQDIRFVVYSKDLPTVSAFEKELHFPKRGLKLKKKNANRTLAKRESGDISSPTGAGMDDFGGWSISIGNVKLEVTEGDVTRATTEAIVNSVSANLDLTLGAVSNAILKAGGREIQDECKRIGKMTDGMVITGAGRLPSKFIFHLKPHNSDRNWKKGIVSCLEEAERRQIRTITFPLLGTGNIGAPVRSMASVMLDSVVNFSTKSSPQHLQLIRIAIFQPHMVEEFAQTIDKKAQELQSSGFLDQFKVYVKSIFGYADKSAALKNFNVEQLPQPKAQKLESTVRLVIYGLAANSIESAICELDDLCNDVIQDKVIDKETIAKLSPEQIERIRNLESEFSTKISVEQGHRLNRIRVQGEGHTIISVVDRIYNIFEEVERKERDEYQAEVVAKQAQWMYQCDDSYDPYPKPINLIIEDAYQKRLPSAKWEEQDGSYRLDFQRMEETKDNDASSKVKVKRTTSESLIPKSWDVMNADEQCRKVLLPSTSQEYQDVMQNVQATAGGTVQQIVSIERIQNPSLYQQYMVRKDAMTMQQLSANASANVPCERVLWHGTSVDTLESINHHGFNRSYCGKNAVVYGRGVYFALNFNYSGANTYAVPDPNGNKHVYQSRVLTGEFAVGSQQYFVPPSKSGSAVDRYDSVVDNPAAPTIFVIFSDTQAYPEYLIVFK